MKENLINKLVCQPWSISRTHGRALITSLVERIRNERPDEDKRGNALPKLRIEGDTAIIPIVGTLALAIPDWLKEYGLGITDVNDVEDELLQAANDPRVAQIVLDFDSPGGWSLAGGKLFQAVERHAAARDSKPLLAWCGDGNQVCSAAYHGATPAHRFLTSPHALAVGCVGSYQPILDDTEFWKMMGISIEVLRSGEMKGMGLDGFSDAQIGWLQSEVDRVGALFRRSVAKYRTLLDPAEMQGQAYDGAQAAELNFTHGLASNLQSAITKFRRSL